MFIKGLIVLNKKGSRKKNLLVFIGLVLVLTLFRKIGVLKD